MADSNTLDNYVIKLRVATFIAVLMSIAVGVFHITNTMNNIDGLQENDVVLDNRISKTTGRNSSDIKDLEKEIVELRKELNKLKNN